MGSGKPLHAGPPPHAGTATFNPSPSDPHLSTSGNPEPSILRDQVEMGRALRPLPCSAPPFPSSFSLLECWSFTGRTLKIGFLCLTETVESHWEVFYNLRLWRQDDLASPPLCASHPPPPSPRRPHPVFIACPLLLGTGESLGHQGAL